MESRLHQLSLNSSPTMVLPESSSRLRSAAHNRGLPNPKSPLNIQSSTIPITMASNQIGLGSTIPATIHAGKSSGVSGNERTYINVNPVAYVGRQGITVNPTSTQLPMMNQQNPKTAASNQPQVPAIPRSQVVKKFVEPSYSTILQPERDAISLQKNQQKNAGSILVANSPFSNQVKIKQNVSTPPPLLMQPHQGNMSGVLVQQQQNMMPMEGAGDGAIYANTYAFNSNVSVASNYSELEALRSSDSQGSTEEELISLNQNQLYSGLTTTDRLSPVSSAYSELRRATQPHPPQATPTTAGYTFQNQNCQNLQYDTSLYEPITPGVRSRTVSVGATLASPAPDDKSNINTMNVHKSTMMKGNYMGAQGGVNHHPFNEGISSDYFGLCSKCCNKIIGEGTGCTAMGRLYHIECFRCTSCECQLQGKPFYALDGKVRILKDSNLRVIILSFMIYKIIAIMIHL